MASGKRKNKLVPPNSHAYSSVADDRIPISVWVKKRKTRVVEENPTRVSNADHCDLDDDYHSGYCSDSYEYSSEKEVIGEKRTTRVFDVDHCDTDDDYLSGFSSSELEWSYSDSSDTDERGGIGKIPIGEEILRVYVMGCITNGIRCRTKTIRKKILSEEHNIKLPTRTARQALNNCLVLMHGSYINSFSLLPDLCRKIKKKNPGSIATWSCHPETKEFEGLCLSYKASIDGFNAGCRPIIALDESLLNSMYGGTVLTATSVDANNGMYPVAIYICRSANIKEWNKFLEIIAPRLMKTKRPITFIHSFRNGISDAVDQNFKDVRCFQRLCARQLYQHICMGFNDPESEAGCAAVKAAKAYNYNEHINAIGKLGDNQRHWVEAGWKTANWARYLYDPSASCPQMTNIFSKALNHWITELKSKPICQWVMGFEAKLIHLFLRRKRNGRLWKSKHLVPRASTKLTIQTRNKIRTPMDVDLEQRRCYCGEWQISGVPCVHAVAILVKEKTPNAVDSYVHEYYTVKKYKESYAGSIKKMPSMTKWRQKRRDILNPPPLKVHRRLS